MIHEYITQALRKASYQIIDKGHTFYGEVKDLRGVWAVGDTLEECRTNLLTTIEGWMIIRFKKNLPIPNFKIPHKKLTNRKYT